MVEAKKRIQQFQNGLSKTFYFALRVLTSLMLGYFSAKCGLFDDLSPFALILLSCSYHMALLPTACYLGSTFGYLSLPFGLYLFKYITALTMVYIVYIVFCRSLHVIRGDMAIISASCCFISGFLFLLIEKLSLFSVLLLVTESVLICCCIFFVTYAVKGFKKNCYLTSRELIAAAVTLILILVSLHNVRLFEMSVARILGLILVYLALNCLKTSHAAVLGSCVGIILSAVANGGEAIFTAFVVGTLMGCVFSTFSQRLAEVSLLVVYYAVLLFFGKFPWNYWLFAEPMAAFAVAFFIPKEKLRRFLGAYITVKLPKGAQKGSENTAKMVECCKRECEAFCPKAIICYQKNAQELVELFEDLTERYVRTEDLGEFEGTLNFCCKPKTMADIISKQLIHSNSERFEDLVEQLDRVTKKLELKMDSSIKTVRFLGDKEEAVAEALYKRSVAVKEINFIVDERDCKRCEIVFEHCGDLLYEKIFSEVLSPHFPKGFEMHLKRTDELGVLYATESDRYRISCAAICKTKEGEEVCGDKALGFSAAKGIFYLMLADGMGSGREAGAQSEATIDTLRRLLAGGLSVPSAVNVYRSAGRFRKGYGFTTVDICRIDLNEGNAEFYKAGAYDSFCINGNRLVAVKGGGMPPGLCEKDRIKHNGVKLSDGDYLIMASDGLSALNEEVENVLLDCVDGDVRLFARKILSILSQKSEGIIGDDVTVIVAKFQKSVE